jgi:hypothetical protein
MKPHVFENMRGLGERIVAVAVILLHHADETFILVMLQKRGSDAEISGKRPDSVVFKAFHGGFSLFFF